MVKRVGYPSNKDSGVDWLGDVPSHWVVARMRFYASPNPSKQEVAHLPPDTEVSFLPMEAVGEDGSLRIDQFRLLGDVTTGYTYFAEGDVSFAKITPCFENGKGALMSGLPGGFGFGTTELTVLRPKTSCNSRFLWWMTQTHPFRRLGEASMYGAGGQKRVPDAFAEDFRSAWPPFTEQNAIVSFLDRETKNIESLINEQHNFIELLLEKRLALISQVVTKGLDPSTPMINSGIEWLGRVPEHWDIIPCRGFVLERSGKNDGAECTDYLSLMANVGIIPYEEKGAFATDGA